MGKSLLEFQPNRGDVLPAHKVIIVTFNLTESLGKTFIIDFSNNTNTIKSFIFLVFFFSTFLETNKINSVEKDLRMIYLKKQREREEKRLPFCKILFLTCG